jgi:hypothetical protein
MHWYFVFAQSAASDGSLIACTSSCMCLCASAHVLTSVLCALSHVYHSNTCVRLVLVCQQVRWHGNVIDIGSQDSRAFTVSNHSRADRGVWSSLAPARLLVRLYACGHSRPLPKLCFWPTTSHKGQLYRGRPRTAATARHNDPWHGSARRVRNVFARHVPPCRRPHARSWLS